MEFFSKPVDKGASMTYNTYKSGMELWFAQGCTALELLRGGGRLSHTL